MRYELMFPEQIRRAIDENRPVVLPIGVLEYHAEHLAVGTDGILVVRIMEKLEKEMDLVILPPFYYGAASFAVAPPERNGTVHVKSEILNLFAKELFASLLRIGFRNIHCIYTHQSENYVQGMPTDLAFKLAGRQAIFEFLENERGEGWWGSEKSKDYYKNHNEKNENPFNWIQVHPLRSPALDGVYRGDHSGILETSFMMSVCPEGVDMDKGRTHWFAKPADNANVEYGAKAAKDVTRELKKLILDEVDSDRTI